MDKGRRLGLDAAPADDHARGVRSILCLAVVLAVPLSAAVLLPACQRDETKPVGAGGSAAGSSAAPAPSIETKTAAGTLRGSWQVDGFVAAPSPSGSSSAAAFEQDKQQAHVQAIRIVYTGDQVKIYEPGQPLLSSSYEVKESHPTWCRLLSGKDEVVITFLDDDHMVIDRKGNAYGAKMKMKRAVDGPGTGKPYATPPSASGSASGSASPPPTPSTKPSASTKL